VTLAAAPASPTGGGHDSGFPAAATAPVGDPHLAVPQRVAGGEACPLCSTPLSPEQDWCLSCGAAARTRLAATPNWKGPIATVAVIAALALAVLAAALVKLAGDSSSSSAPATTTITTPAASTPAAPTTPAPGAATTPAATTPGAALPGASTPTTNTPAATTTTGAGGTAGAGATTGAGGTAGPGGTTSSKAGALDKTGHPLTPAQREALRKFKRRVAGK
jgi:hypothetical protein